MADFQAGRQEVFNRLKNRMGQYRSNQNIKAINHEPIFQELVEQESKRTVQLKQKYTEPKNKNKGRREKKDTNQSNMGQMKMLTRPLDSSEDNMENPSKKPRLSGPPCQPGPPLVPQSASGSGPGVPPYKNNISTPSTIDNYHMGQQQQQISLQNIKKNGSPPPILLPTSSTSSLPPTTTSVANSSSLDDIKKEDLDISDLNGVFSFDDFQLLKGIDLDNLCDEWSFNSVKAENPFLLNDVDEIEELIARDSASDGANNFSAVSNVQSTFMTSNCTNSTTSTSQSFSTLPSEDNTMRPNIPQSSIPVTQPNTNNPAATTLKNMAQVHQKQQYNPASIRPQTYPDFNNPRMGPGGGLGPINNMMQSAPQNPQAMYSQSNMVPQQYPRQQMMVRPHGPPDQCTKGAPMGTRIPSPHTAPTRQQQQSVSSNDSQLPMRNMSVSNSIPNSNKIVNSINRAVTPTISERPTSTTSSIPTATTTAPSTAISKAGEKASSTPPSTSTASTPPHSEAVQYQQMMQSPMAASANFPTRMSPNMYQGGVPASQYPGNMIRPGMRPAYHRGPTPQGQVGVDGKMSQEMYYGSQMSSQQQYAMMGGGQPPRYPGGQMMIRGMSSQQMMQGGQVMGGNRPPPPEYRHATNLMHQQQQQQQHMLMYPSNIRQTMNPMTSMSNGVSQSGTPMASNQNMSGSMPQQAQNLPPSLPSMKSGGSPVMQQSMGVPNISHIGRQMMSQNCPPGMMQSGHPMMNQRAQMMMRGYPQQQPGGMMVQGSQQMMGMQRAGSAQMIYPQNMGPGMNPNMGSMPGQMQPGMPQMQPGMGGQMQPGMQQMQPGMGVQMQSGMSSQMQTGMPAQMQPGMMGQMQSGMHGGMPQNVRMQHSMGSSMGQMPKGISMSQNGGSVMQGQYPGQVNAMGQMAGHNGQMAVQGGQMAGVNGQMAGHGAQMAGARRMGPTGADTGDKDPMGSCNGQMTGMPSPANSHHLMGGVRSPANMGHQQGGNMSPAQMGGGMNGAPSPANMGPGMAHPRSPAGMLHPRSPATSVGGRPLSNPGIGGQSPLPGKNNPPSSLPSQQRPPSVGGRNSQPPTPNQSHSGGGNTPHHSATSPPQPGLEFDNYLNSYDPSASQPNFESLIDHN